MLLLMLFFLVIHPLFAEVSSESFPAQWEESSTVSIEELAVRYDAFFLDAYGVFWGSSDIGVLPGAAEAMAYLVSRGKYVGILSNTAIFLNCSKNKRANPSSIRLGKDIHNIKSHSERFTFLY